VNFGLTDDQQEIRRTAREFLAARYPPEEVRRLAELEREYEGRDVPRPPHWGGFLLVPGAVEFWQGRTGRLHDRFRYAREGAGWLIERLAP
jgi:pyridoxine/pyridoxamine 5'-phosphate oxidase